MDFVGRHPEYSISGKLMIENLRTPFTYTASELDNILAASSGMWDKARYDSLKKAVDDNRKYLRGADYTDFAVLDPEGRNAVFPDLWKTVSIFWLTSGHHGAVRVVWLSLMSRSCIINIPTL